MKRNRQPEKALFKRHNIDQNFLIELTESILKHFNAEGVEVVLVPFHKMNRLPEDLMSTKTNFDFGVYTEFNRRIKIVSDGSIEQFLSTLFHELTHYLQYRLGDLSNVFDEEGNLTHFLFQDIHYDFDHPYEFRPWEIEATANETLLWLNFMENTKDEKILRKVLSVYEENIKKEKK